MRRFSLVMSMMLAAVTALSGPAQARDHETREPRQRSFMTSDGERESRRDSRRESRRESVRESEQARRQDSARDERGDRFMERRERMRSLREEMERPPSRQAPFRDEEDRRPRADDRELRPAPREAQGLRRLSPEERRVFRQQLHEAGRNVYRDH